MIVFEKQLPVVRVSAWKEGTCICLVTFYKISLTIKYKR